MFHSPPERQSATNTFGNAKAIAMGTPDVKAVCMGRGLMIPGMVGKNIAKWIEDDDLPKTVSQYGRRVEGIFVHYEELVDRFSKVSRTVLRRGRASNRSSLFGGSHMKI